MNKIGVVLFVCLVLAGPLNATERIVLDNGLTVIYKRNPASRLTVVTAFIKGGTYAEKEGEAGAVNLLQKLLLKGTIDRSAEQIATGIESLGGSINTEAGNDYALVSLIVPTRYFEKGFEIFTDVLKNPAFPQVEIEKEKKAVIAGIRARHDEIFPYTYDQFLKTLYGAFPYNRSTPGNEEAVSRMGKDVLARYHRQLYAPNNIILVVLTGMRLKKITSSVDKEFGSLLPFDRGKDEVEGPLPHREPLLIKKEREFMQAYLMLGYLAPAAGSEDYPVMKLINELLGGGASSRIFVGLREKEGLAYELGSFYPSRRYTSGAVVYMGLSPGNVEKARNKLLDEISALPEGLTKEGVENAKAFLIGKFIMDHASSPRRAWYLGWYEALGMGYRYDEKYPEQIAKVKMEDIKKVHSAYFKGNNWVCVEVKPPKKQ